MCFYSIGYRFIKKNCGQKKILTVLGKKHEKTNVKHKKTNKHGECFPVNMWNAAQNCDGLNLWHPNCALWLIEIFFYLEYILG